MAPDGTDWLMAWADVAVDGVWEADAGALRAGAAVERIGEAVRVPPGAGRAEDLLAAGDLAAPGPGHAGDAAPLVLTDGHEIWSARRIATRGRALLAARGHRPPPRRAPLWLLAAGPARPAGGVICFTPGTSILTPDGARPVETLAEGDRVQTADGGGAEILWLARRRISGARLAVDPSLAPIRLASGALDRDVPDAGLVVSPDHRLVLRGPRARDLSGADELLVPARDLVDGVAVTVHRVPEVTYIHLLLPAHAIVFANGVATESFHPATAALATLGEADRARLDARHPDAAWTPFARRLASPAEGAALRHGLA